MTPNTLAEHLKTYVKKAWNSDPSVPITFDLKDVNIFGEKLCISCAPMMGEKHIHISLAAIPGESPDEFNIRLTEQLQGYAQRLLKVVDIIHQA